MNMSEHELNKIRMRKADMLFRLQSIPQTIVNIKDIDQFNKLLSDFPDKIVIIDFWAVWCGPCKAFAPVFEKLQQEYKTNFIFIKVNVDDNQVIARHYNVASIPSTLFIKGGKVINKIVGSVNYNTLKQFLQKLSSKY